MILKLCDTQTKDRSPEKIVAEMLGVVLLKCGTRLKPGGLAVSCGASLRCLPKLNYWLGIGWSPKHKLIAFQARPRSSPYLHNRDGNSANRLATGPTTTKAKVLHHLIRPPRPCLATTPQRQRPANVSSHNRPTRPHTTNTQHQEIHTMPSFKPNDIVELTDGSGRHATVRFAGTTSFQVGEWVGIELEDLSGKNDGSVKGESYFECEMGRGMFVRPAALTLVKSFVPPASAMGRRTSVASSTTSTAGGAVKRTSRPSSLIQSSAPGRRAGSVSDAVAAKRMSMNAASPTPSASRELGMRPASMSRVCQFLSLTFPYGS